MKVFLVSKNNIGCLWQVSTGEVDGKRLCIDGRSAGGYTTLAALVFSNTFNAGASLYGVKYSFSRFLSYVFGFLRSVMSDCGMFDVKFIEWF